jgi:RNA polymerase sigma-70 factor (ECF subfamily)
MPLAGVLGRPLGVRRHSDIHAVMPIVDHPVPANDDTGLIEFMTAVANYRDRQAFARLFDHFAPRLKAYMRQLGADPAIAEDLVQDVMLTVWRRAEQYDPSKAGVATWIFTIARNKRIDGLRRERRPAFDPKDPALVPDPEPDADTSVHNRQQTAHIRTAIAGLPAEQARMLRLAYFEDRSHSDIAGALGLPLGTVKSRIRLAMKKLKSQLAELR